MGAIRLGVKRLNNIAAFFLNAIERSILSATSTNFQSLADHAEPSLHVAGLNYSHDPEVSAAMRRIEDLIIALCVGLSDNCYIPRDVTQLRRDALAELARTRLLIGIGLPCI